MWSAAKCGRTTVGAARPRDEPRNMHACILTSRSFTQPGLKATNLEGRVAPSPNFFRFLPYQVESRAFATGGSGVRASCLSSQPAQRRPRAHSPLRVRSTFDYCLLALLARVRPASESVMWVMPPAEAARRASDPPPSGTSTSRKARESNASCAAPDLAAARSVNGAWKCARSKFCAGRGRRGLSAMRRTAHLAAAVRVGDCACGEAHMLVDGWCVTADYSFGLPFWCWRLHFRRAPRLRSP